MINLDVRFTPTLELNDKGGRTDVRNASYVSAELVEYQNVDSETIKSKVPNGAENSPLQATTTEETRENDDGLAESAIDEGSELDEEKNESEIVNVNFRGDPRVVIKYLAIKRRSLHTLEKHIFGKEHIFLLFRWAAVNAPFPISTARY